MSGDLKVGSERMAMARSSVAAWMRVAASAAAGKPPSGAIGGGRWATFHADEGHPDDARDDDRHERRRSPVARLAPGPPRRRRRRSRPARRPSGPRTRGSGRWAGPAPRPRGSPRRRSGSPPSRAARGRASGPPSAPRRPGCASARRRSPMTTASAATAAAREFVINPVSGHDTTRMNTTRTRVDERRRDRVAARLQVVERGPDLGEVGRQLVDDERDVGQRDDRQTGKTRADDGLPVGPGRPAPRVGDEQRADDREQRRRRGRGTAS